MNDKEKSALEAFSHGQMTVVELRRRLGDATYGGVLSLLSQHDLPLPRASQSGREAQIERARTWMFPPATR